MGDEPRAPVDRAGSSRGGAVPCRAPHVEGTQEEPDAAEYRVGRLSANLFHTASGGDPRPGTRRARRLG